MVRSKGGPDLSFEDLLGGAKEEPERRTPEQIKQALSLFTAMAGGERQ